MPELTETGHTPITILVGPQDCFERECEEYVTEDGDDRPEIQTCSHITEQRVCEQCSTEGPDGEYDPVAPWTGPHDSTIDAEAAPGPCGKPIPGDRKAYCSDRCKREDDNHGPDTEPAGGEES